MDVNELVIPVLLIETKFHVGKYRYRQTLLCNLLPDDFQFVLSEIKVVRHGDEGQMMRPQRANIILNIVRIIAVSQPRQGAVDVQIPFIPL